MIKIRVPASSANMGPGFDSLGVALGLYNYVSAEETNGGIEIDIKDESRKFLPQDETNLIYRSMYALFDKVGYKPKGIKIVLENNVPVTRGLGSSSASIVGGLVAANEISKADLSRDELLNIAAEIEGHADNVTPSIMGGFTVNSYVGGNVNYVKVPLKNDLKFVTFVPDFFLQTSRARAVLPKMVSHKDAVYNAGHTALLTASIMNGDYEKIRYAIGDRLHQHYRKKLIPGMDDIFKISYRHGALGVYLSGAGPTIVAIIKSDNKAFKDKVGKSLYSRLGKMENKWKIDILKADNEGAKIIG